MTTNLYFYKAKVTSVYDGDTITADIDLGLGVFVTGEKLRLSRINAPEIRGDEERPGCFHVISYAARLMARTLLFRRSRIRKENMADTWPKFSWLMSFGNQCV